MIIFNGRIYWSEEDAMIALMEKYPEAGSDRLVELSESLFEEYGEEI